MCSLMGVPQAVTEAVLSTRAPRRVVLSYCRLQIPEDETNEHLGRGASDEEAHNQTGIQVTRRPVKAHVTGAPVKEPTSPSPRALGTAR